MKDAIILAAGHVEQTRRVSREVGWSAIVVSLRRADLPTGINTPHARGVLPLPQRLRRGQACAAPPVEKNVEKEVASPASFSPNCLPRSFRCVDLLGLRAQSSA